MNAVTRHGVSIALACRTFQISETCYRYSPVLSDENEEIAEWLERLTANKRSWGSGLSRLSRFLGLIRAERIIPHFIPPLEDNPTILKEIQQEAIPR